MHYRAYCESIASDTDDQMASGMGDLLDYWSQLEQEAVAQQYANNAVHEETENVMRRIGEQEHYAEELAQTLAEKRVELISLYKNGGRLGQRLELEKTNLAFFTQRCLELVASVGELETCVNNVDGERRQHEEVLKSELVRFARVEDDAQRCRKELEIIHDLQVDLVQRTEVCQQKIQRNEENSLKATASIAATGKVVERLERKKGDTLKMCTDLEDTITSLKRQLASENTTKARHESNRVEQEGILQSSLTAIEEFRKKCKHLEKEINEIEHESKRVSVEISKRNENVLSEIRVEIDNGEGKKSELSAQCNKAQVDLEKLKKNVDAAKDDIAQCNELVASSGREIAEASRELENAKILLERERAGLDREKYDMAELQKASV